MTQTPVNEANAVESAGTNGGAPGTGQPQSALLVTCTMATDLELFALLAESVDRHVDPAIAHRVVVPGAQLNLFRRFASARREIVAQEDILPFRIWKAPGALRHLSFAAAGFRRPIYVTSRLKAIRGWMLQQLIKIAVTQSSTDTAVVHCDSDMCFVRTMPLSHVLPGGRAHFFSTPIDDMSDEHLAWARHAAALLGTEVPADFHKTYIENGIVWSPKHLRAMVTQLEQVQGRPVQDVLISERSMSEYYLYGVFLDFAAGLEGVTPRAFPICRSLWEASVPRPDDIRRIAAGMKPDHVAVALQSTHDVPLAERKRIYASFEAELAKAASGPQSDETTLVSEGTAGA